MGKHKNETKQERRIRRALRSYRCRTLKNFFIWLWGVISFVILAVAAGAIVLMAIPTKDLLGQDADKAGVIAEKNLLEAIMGINSYTFKDVPFAVDTINDLLETEIMEGKKVKDFVTIDTTGLDDVKLLDFPNVIGDRFQVVATIDNVVGLDSLGDIGNISVFSSWDEVTEPIDESAETFNPYLYYYKNSSDKYVRAYTNDKQKVAPAGATIYYAALGYIPVTEAVNVVADSFGRAKLTDLLTNLGGADLSGENSLVGKLLGDKTVSQIGNITTSDIILYDILGGEPTDTIYKVLEGATGVSYDQISLDHLTGEGFKVNNITIDSILGEDGGEIGEILSAALEGKPYSSITISDLTSADFSIDNIYIKLFIDSSSEIATVISSALDKDFDKITIGHLSAKDPVTNEPLLNIDNVLLSSVMTDVKDTDTIAKIIVAATPATSWGTATVNNLSNFNTNNIPLTTVLPVQVKNEFGTVTTDNTKLYAILEKATKTTTENMTVGSLNSFNTDNILLSSVLEKSKAGEFANILEDIFGDNSYDTITLQNINGLELGKVKLATVMGEINATLKDILEDEYVDGNEIKSYKDITLNHLKNFSVDALHLYKVLPGEKLDANLKNILMQITGETDYDKIYVENLLNEKDVLSKITLSTVLGDAEISNPILKQLVAKNVAVNGIDSAISSLSLYSVFGENAFTTDSTNATTTTKKYVKTSGNKVTYTLDNNGTYYISKDAGVWLLLCFDATELDENGSPNKYVESSLSVNDLTNGSSISTKISNATIRELKDVGIISESVSSSVDHLTLVDALKMIGG